MQIKKKIKITPVTIAHGRVILQFLVLIYHSKLSNTNFINHFPVECLHYKKTAKANAYELWYIRQQIKYSNLDNTVSLYLTGWMLFHPTLSGCTTERDESLQGAACTHWFSTYIWHFRQPRPSSKKGHFFIILNDHVCIENRICLTEFFIFLQPTLQQKWNT